MQNCFHEVVLQYPVSMDVSQPGQLPAFFPVIKSQSAPMESGQFPPAGKSSQADGGGAVDEDGGGGAVAEKYVFNLNIQVVSKYKF